MLNLKSIRKDYVTSSETVHALKGVSISFRKTEFVSILGPSGCGKTTMLNIIGGLDHYTDGDLIIGGRSTKEYGDRDWDVYRNHKVGFIFQNYNLIPHQNVLTNVELALTIAGISKEERVERAKIALDRVGLSDQYYKKPNQLSGGQCQRVAIARALVNNPEILLADEPTGALDTVTSVQIMELIKEISAERLVIMVTHNPELAEEYSSRIVRLLDGEVIEDTNPMTEAEELAETTAIETEKAAYEAELAALEKKERRRKIKASKEKAKMSFFTAFKLSLKNLFTKKGRSTLTAFAGSIGIIGIALILAVSNGMTSYINSVQESTLSAYPLTIESTNVDITALMESFSNVGGDPDHEMDGVYKDPMVGELIEAISKIEENENDLGAFKAYLDAQLQDPESPLYGAVSGIQYSYNINIPIYTKNKNGDIIKSDKGELLTKMIGEYMIGIAEKMGMGDSMASGGSSAMSSSMMSSMMGVQLWQELLPGLADENGNRPYVSDMVYDQYELVHGNWPAAANEIVIVLNENNEVDDLTLYALGLLSQEELDAIIDSAVNGTPLPASQNKWTYKEICELTFKTIFPYDFYVKQGDVYKDMSDDTLLLNALYNKAYELNVVGIIRPNADSDAAMLKGSIAYTYAFTELVINNAYSSEVVKAQLANPQVDVTNNLPFKENTGSLTSEQKQAAFTSYLNTLSAAKKAEVYVKIMCLAAEAEQLDAKVEQTLNGIKMMMQHNPDYILDMIITSLGSQSSADPETVKNYFKDMTEEELIAIIRPSIVEKCRNDIHNDEAADLNGSMSEEEMRAALDAMLNPANSEDAPTLDDYVLWYDNITEFSTQKYSDALVKIGCVDLDVPFTINLYASTFEAKDTIVEEIDRYNASVPEEQKISYTDIMGILMSSITTIINAITYVLIAFVAISLIVSSIMIGVITLISVQERTKEIGVLRAIGASKRDVSSMFNAETIIIGLASGLLGVIITYLLCIPINLILHSLTGISNLSAILPISGAAILVTISVLLTLFAGFIPSRSAAKKDPVVALRTE